MSLIRGLAAIPLVLLLSLTCCSSPASLSAPNDEQYRPREIAVPSVADAAFDSSIADAAEDEDAAFPLDAGVDACAPDPCRCDYAQAACGSSYDCGIDQVLCPTEDPYVFVAPAVCGGKNHRLSGRAGCQAVGDALCCVFAESH